MINTLNKLIDILNFPLFSSLNQYIKEIIEFYEINTLINIKDNFSNKIDDFEPENDIFANNEITPISKNDLIPVAQNTKEYMFFPLHIQKVFSSENSMENFYNNIKENTTIKYLSYFKDEKARLNAFDNTLRLPYLPSKYADGMFSMQNKKHFLQTESGISRLMENPEIQGGTEKNYIKSLFEFDENKTSEPPNKIEKQNNIQKIQPPILENENFQKYNTPFFFEEQSENLCKKLVLDIKEAAQNRCNQKGY